ncbi:hypothetical protein [Pseudolysinimonas sp.]|uniref:hypothetical protein n=1 Tax=Pseudolysinimonas sp. TaxID=2680009 RepID=UPI00286BCDBC|nr:hypothetical protein [Pseudolysinimonas sp.]
MRRIASIGSIAGAAMLLLASSSLVVQGVTDELNPDAAWYASRYGVSDVEAGRRLGLQAVAGELDAKLTALDVDWYGGLWLEHEPDFKVVVFTTRGTSGPIRDEARELGLEGLVEVRAVAFSYADLEAESEKLRGLALESDSLVSIDVPANKVLVLTASPHEFARLAEIRGVRLSPAVTIRESNRQVVLSTNIYAGLTLYSGGIPECTSGYSIRKNSTGELGITTASHCKNALTFGAVNLTFRESAQWGSYDSQWHTVGSHTVRNWATDGIPGGSTPGYRIITSKTTRANQALNAVACRYGFASLYACGNLISKTVLCELLPSPNSTCMWLSNGSTDDLASPGDSGGPVYSGGSAWGIIHACLSFFEDGCLNPSLNHDLIYIAENYVEAAHGLTILTSAP